MPTARVFNYDPIGHAAKPGEFRSEFELNTSRSEWELQKGYCESVHTQDLCFKSGSVFTVS